MCFINRIKNSTDDIYKLETIMRIVYYDESGDDGYPKYSSPLFCLTAVYMHYLKWKENYEIVSEFRRKLKSEFNFPIKLEMHTKQFLLDKNPFRDFKFSRQDRKKILTLYCQMISKLELKVINVVSIKDLLKKEDFDILDKTLTYSIQRIDNDLKSSSNPNDRFVIITDNGRLGKMRKTTRKIQKVNFIPSQYSTSKYRNEIKCLIEDPLPKDSKESYFIQISDLIAYLVYNFTLCKYGIGELPNRLKLFTSFEEIESWLNILKPVLNTKASKHNEYGIVFHPKP